MAEATAPKARRKPQGPRQQRPVFAIVTYTDSEGNAAKLNASGLSIKIERDSAKIVELLTGDDASLQGAAVVKVDLPQPQQRAKAEPAA
jgi:hypothetical protein